MEVEMYVLGLPNFRDDTVVFGSEELDSIKKEISKYLRKKGLSKEESEAPGGWHVYKLNPERLYIEKPANSVEPYIRESTNFEIHLAELGYYHHRVITHLKLDLFDFYISEKNKIELKKSIYGIIEKSTCCTREEIQKRLNKPVRNIINEYLEEKIDEISTYGKNGRNERIENYIDKKVSNELKKIADNLVNEYIRKKTDEFKFLERKIRIKEKIKICVQEELKEWKNSRTELEKLKKWKELKSDLTEIEELKSDLTEIEELKSGLEELINNTVDEQMTELEKLEELIDSIIDELLKGKKTDEPEFTRRNEIKEKIESYFQIKLKQLEELKSELRESNKLGELKKSEELINNIIDGILKKEIDELKSAKKNEIKEKIRICIQEKLEKDIKELNRKLEEYNNFRDKLKRLIELKNKLRESLDILVLDYMKEQKNSFYSLEKIRNNEKKLVNCIFNIYLRKEMNKLNTFKEIGIGEKIGLYILENIRRISLKFIDYKIDFIKTIEQSVSGMITICGTIRRLGTLNMCLEIKLRELLSEKIEKREDKFLALRDARKQLERGTRNIINDCVIENVNKLIRSGKVTEKGKIEFIYTYPLIVVKSSAEKHESVPFSEETTSLCFEIAEPKWWPLSGRKHMMRISIPSTILYVQKSIGKDLLRDIINAIYQYCLYEKKAKDEKKKLIDWKNGPYDNQLDEDILTKLWEHALHAMGGRSTDLRVVRITNMTRLIALLAFLVSAASFFLTIYRILN